MDFWVRLFLFVGYCTGIGVAAFLGIFGILTLIDFLLGKIKIDWFKVLVSLIILWIGLYFFYPWQATT